MTRGPLTHFLPHPHGYHYYLGCYYNHNWCASWQFFPLYLIGYIEKSFWGGRLLVNSEQHLVLFLQIPHIHLKFILWIVELLNTLLMLVQDSSRVLLCTILNQWSASWELYFVVDIPSTLYKAYKCCTPFLYDLDFPLLNGFFYSQILNFFLLLKGNWPRLSFIMDNLLI